MQETRQQIIEILKQRSHATVDDLAQALDLTTMTVRHHLGILEEQHLVLAEPQRGRVGRPFYMYHLTAAADDLFPKGYHLLAERILAKVKEQYGIEAARCILKAVADDLVAAHTEVQPGDLLPERLVHIEDIMAAEGFRVRVSQCDQPVAIEVCNCAYRHVAAQHPEVCELDHALMEGLLGQPLDRVKYAPAGDDCCRFEVARSTS